VSFGEIDIIAKDGNTLSFIEVKYRSNSRYGYPGEALTQKKQNTIKRVAGIYLSKINLWIFVHIVLTWLLF
jgi:putative endonuclease